MGRYELKRKLLNAFQSFDRDCTGRITREELDLGFEIFSKKMNIKAFEKPEISVKSDSEGKINYIAFSRAFAYT